MTRKFSGREAARIATAASDAAIEAIERVIDEQGLPEHDEEKMALAMTSLGYAFARYAVALLRPHTDQDAMGLMIGRVNQALAMYAKMRSEDPEKKGAGRA